MDINFNIAIMWDISFLGISPYWVTTLWTTQYSGLKVMSLTGQL